MIFIINIDVAVANGENSSRIRRPFSYSAILLSIPR